MRRSAIQGGVECLGKSVGSSKSDLSFRHPFKGPVLADSFAFSSRASIDPPLASALLPAAVIPALNYVSLIFIRAAADVKLQPIEVQMDLRNKHDNMFSSAFPLKNTHTLMIKAKNFKVLRS